MKVAGGKARPQGETHPPEPRSKKSRAPAGRMRLTVGIFVMRPPRGAGTSPTDPVGALGFTKLPTGYLHPRLQRDEAPCSFHRKQRGAT